MAKVIWHTTMSLDGYIAGPNDEIEWAIGHGPSGEIARETEEATGAIIMGRRLYDVAAELHEDTGGIYGGRFKGAVFVLTSHPEDAPDDPAVRFLSGGFEQAIATVHVAPVLLGDGKRLYGDGVERVDLERIGLTHGDQVVDLRYRVIRS
jgi:dihydrofolate reductase